jgi:hypothetical protein
MIKDETRDVDADVSELERARATGITTPMSSYVLHQSHCINVIRPAFDRDTMFFLHLSSIYWLTMVC